MNSPSSVVPEDAASTGFTSGLLSAVWAFLMATRTELFLFFVAVTAYATLFGNANPRHARSAEKSAKGKKQSKDDFEEQKQSSYQYQDIDKASLKDIEKTVQVAFSNGDHRVVLKCWSALKKFDETPTVSLANVVESMQRTKKDTKAVAVELLQFFKKHSSECDIIAVNDIMDSLSRRLDTALAQEIMEILPVLRIRPDAVTYEMLLSMHFTTRNFVEVKRLTEEMTEAKVPLTVRATVVVIKAALKDGNLSSAMTHFSRLKMVWERGGEASGTPSMAPQHIIAQLVDAACKDRQLPDFLPLLKGVPLNDEVLGTMLSECIRQKDSDLASQVERLGREQNLKFSDNTYSLLVKASGGQLRRVKAIVEEIASSGKKPSPETSIAVLSACAHNGSCAVHLVDRLLELTRPLQTQLLSGFVRYYAESELHEAACKVYKESLSEVAEGNQGSVLLDSRAERALVNAALKCGHSDLAQAFLEAAPADVAKHVTMIRNCAAAGDLPGVMKVFETLKKSGGELNSVVYNTVLDACVECQAVKEAESWMRVMKDGGFTDIVSYNTLIKAYLQNQDFDKARSLMEEMKQLGHQPNRVTFNELVNGLVTRGTSAQKAQVWTIIGEMKEAGVTPNQVTCSILLKSLSSRSAEKDIYHTMDLISAMGEEMDEVLLSSVVEACVRIGKMDLLSTKLRQLQGHHNIKISGSHTFGSLIKGYGHAKDIDGAWRCWKEMRSRYIKPTSITLGCMVEAVVNNGDAEGAYELIHQIRDDDRCKDTLNSVIYCSVLKGFTREKKLDRVWAVYEEMLATNVDLSIVTYNTLIDACARCKQMDRVPAIVEDMELKKVQQNIITYSTRLKGYCQVGDLQKGFQILEEMRQKTSFKPDEIMYNSLLDGCAQNSLVEEGLKLLETMQEQGVPPSNFTLSLLVKLMSRARKLDMCFSLVEEISKKFRLKPNVHVYTNLIQACIYARQLPRGMSCLETMIEAWIQPENRTIAVLMRANLQQGNGEQAAALIRAALGVPQAVVPFLAANRSTAICHNLDASVVSECLMGLMDSGRGQELAAPLLADVKQYKPRLYIDASVQRRLLSGSAEDDFQGYQSYRQGKGGGKKGSGKGSYGKGNNQYRN
eukprot:TRINITY_DN811_c0_g1_i1.p1 TRINITY_DN811_c0_g1~~TRINITY_DN811_c0_g1_i1.p1  ORF type:complete len:1117 (-),score=302.97 TRINITY_DN811_c0_g1_i1:180-3530(-)